MFERETQEYEKAHPTHIQKHKHKQKYMGFKGFVQHAQSAQQTNGVRSASAAGGHAAQHAQAVTNGNSHEVGYASTSHYAASPASGPAMQHSITEPNGHAAFSSPAHLSAMPMPPPCMMQQDSTFAHAENHTLAGPSAAAVDLEVEGHVIASITR